MKKQIILATVSAFMVSYVLHLFIIFDFDLRNWTPEARAGYFGLSIFLSLGFSVMGYIRKKINELQIKKRTLKGNINQPNKCSGVVRFPLSLFIIK